MKSRGNGSLAAAFLAVWMVIPAASGLGQNFRRGDANADGAVDIGDAIAILGHLFGGSFTPDCHDALDANDSGELDIADAIFTLSYLFAKGREPPLPGPRQCGPDPTGDALGCERHAACEQPFAYRKSIRLSAGSGAGSGYQVRIAVGQSEHSRGYDLHAEGKCRPDFGDIRFAARDGKGLLDCWLESVSGASPAQTAVFWVKVAADLDQAQEIYVYYGNPVAVPAGNIGTTFKYYDGFEGAFYCSFGALANAPFPESTPTYDGSGQCTHPDIVYFNQGWHGYRYWMAMTPYPESEDWYENPSILVSNNMLSWITPPGLQNPLVGPPPCDHNCDADIVYAPEKGQLMVFYLDTRRASRCPLGIINPYHNYNCLNVLKSSDGLHWQGPTVSIAWDLGAEPLYVSPAVVRIDGSHYYLWVSNGSDTVLRYASADGENWGAPQAVSLDCDVWHLDVRYIPEKSEYWMLSSFPTAGGSLRWATSTDGLNWQTYPDKPVLAPTESGWDQNLYRSTFLYNQATDMLDVWYSAYATASNVWHIGRTRGDYSTFLNSLESRCGGWSVHRIGGSWSTSGAQVKRGNSSGMLNQTVSASRVNMIVYKRPGFPMNGHRVEWDLYDDMDPTAMKLVRVGDGFVNTSVGQQTGLGVWTGASTDYYVYHDNAYSYHATSVRRSLGWHKFGIWIRSDGSVAFSIDDIPAGSLASQFAAATAVSIEGYHDGLTTFYVDDLRVRKAALREPALATVGAQEAGPWLLP